MVLQAAMSPRGPPDLAPLLFGASVQRHPPNHVRHASSQHEEPPVGSWGHVASEQGGASARRLSARGVAQ